MQIKNKSTLIFIPLFLFLFNANAAIFLPKTTHLQEQTSIGTNEIIKEGQKKESKVSKKDKKVNKEKEGKVDKFAKWGFISSVVGFASLFILPFLAFALLPVGIGFSIAGLSATAKNKTRGKGLAIAGLAIGSAGILLTLLAIVLVVAFFASF
jgi:hypothetical protein